MLRPTPRGRPRSAGCGPLGERAHRSYPAPVHDLSRSDRPQLDIGRQLGPYRIDALIGTGGMGEVYRAVRGTNSEPVALKVIKPRFALDTTAVRRFLHEARAAAEVDHEHLLGVIDTGEADGIPYLVMPYVGGRTLEQRLRDEGPLGVEETNRMAAEVGSALDALHARGLVHRDIKASNIIFMADGSAALMDFGLAKGSGYSVLT